MTLEEPEPLRIRAPLPDRLRNVVEVSFFDPEDVVAAIGWITAHVGEHAG